MTETAKDRPVRPAPARLHVLLAREAPRGVVLRRGPSRAVASLLWDLRDDRVTLGQWLGGRIYERRCDLSPDGRHMIVFAARHNRGAGGPGFATWTAVSRAPHLTALDLWEKGDAWQGGGQFLDDRRYWIWGAHREIRRESGLEPVAPRLGRARNNECLGIYVHRLERDGWQRVSETPDWSRTAFRKPLGAGWTLHKIAEAAVPPRERGGIYADRHLLEGPAGAVETGDGWEWADAVPGGLAYAEAGCLWRRAIADAALGPPRLVHDFNDMSFEAVPGPG